MALYITGDIHGDVVGLKQRLDQQKIPEGATIILNGDVGLNYWGNKTDAKNKAYLAALPYSFLCVHGNHEARPWEVEDYEILEPKSKLGGRIYFQPKYPTINFLDDDVYTFDGKKILVLGGAYSVDKFHRIAQRNKWWDSEQMTLERQKFFLEKLQNESFDVVISHTCPYMARPLEKGLSFIDNATVDSSMEVFLEHIRQQISYKQWYAGHWHIDEKRKDIGGEVHFLYYDVVKL